MKLQYFPLGVEWSQWREALIYDCSYPLMLLLETNYTPYFSVLVTFFQPDGFACIFLEELIITDEEDCFLSFLKKKKSKKTKQKKK